MSLMGNFFGIGNNNMSANNPLSGIMNMASMFQKFREFAQNPFAALMKMNSGVSIPQNISNDPQAMVQHLIQSGQMSQEQFQQFSQSANQLQNMLPKF